MKNQTGLKALDKLAEDPRVVRIWDEGADGLWLQLADGFNHEGRSCLHANPFVDEVTPSQRTRVMVAMLKRDMELVEPGETY